VTTYSRTSFSELPGDRHGSAPMQRDEAAKLLAVFVGTRTNGTDDPIGTESLEDGSPAFWEEAISARNPSRPPHPKMLDWHAGALLERRRREPMAK